MKKPGKIPPSIFNDVIGPVMRGPSSSHCAGALRIGRIARDVMGGVIDEVVCLLSMVLHLRQKWVAARRKRVPVPEWLRQGWWN